MQLNALSHATGNSELQCSKSSALKTDIGMGMAANTAVFTTVMGAILATVLRDWA